MEMTINKFENRITPERINRLGANEVFVFGSNARGFIMEVQPEPHLKGLGLSWDKGMGCKAKAMRLIP